MINTVLASIEFDFKGVRYNLSAIIDIDICMRHDEPMQYIYHMLAAENGIGLYTYELEVMAMEKIEFSEPSSLVSKFLNDGLLDLEGLHKAWQIEKTHSILQPIAQKHLGIETLNDHPELKAALIEAYEAR